MGTGAEVRYILWGVIIRAFHHINGEPCDIGQELFLFLSDLSEKGWSKLERALRTKVEWYGNSRQKNAV